MKALEQQIKIKPVDGKPPVKPVTPPPTDGSVSSDDPWVVQTNSSYAWGDGNYTLDAQGAAAELLCSINKYCWCNGHHRPAVSTAICREVLHIQR